MFWIFRRSFFLTFLNYIKKQNNSRKSFVLKHEVEGVRACAHSDLEKTTEEQNKTTSKALNINFSQWTTFALSLTPYPSLPLSLFSHFFTHTHTISHPLFFNLSLPFPFSLLSRLFSHTNTHFLSLSFSPPSLTLFLTLSHTFMWRTEHSFSLPFTFFFSLSLPQTNPSFPTLHFLTETRSLSLCCYWRKCNGLTLSLSLSLSLFLRCVREMCARRPQKQAFARLQQPPVERLRMVPVARTSLAKRSTIS